MNILSQQIVCLHLVDVLLVNVGKYTMDSLGWLNHHAGDLQVAFDLNAPLSVTVTGTTWGSWGV